MSNYYYIINVEVCRLHDKWGKSQFSHIFLAAGDGQVDFDEFVTILGPKLLSSDTREGFLGSTIDSIFWQV